jgi:hypothetical protein
VHHLNEERPAMQILQQPTPDPLFHPFFSFCRKSSSNFFERASLHFNGVSRLDIARKVVCI